MLDTAHIKFNFLLFLCYSLGAMGTSNKDLNSLVNFFFEVGTLRKIPRSHSQSLLTGDLSDNIASHSFRVVLIAFFLAKLEKANIEKVLTMAIFHDIPEARSGDQNWIHKRYVKVLEDEIILNQISPLPSYKNLLKIIKEYNERKTKEALVAKDADLLDQILLLKEYAHMGNKEAEIWLKGKDKKARGNAQLALLKTNSAKKLGEAILRTLPGDWWLNLSTSKRL